MDDCQQPLKSVRGTGFFGWLGRDDIILHTMNITRNRNGFEQLKDESSRNRFMAELNALMRSLDYTIVACTIRKDTHFDRVDHHRGPSVQASSPRSIASPPSTRDSLVPSASRYMPTTIRPRSRPAGTESG